MPAGYRCVPEPNEVAAAVLVAEYLAHRDRGERRVLGELFNRMVDKDVAEALWQRRDELLEEGHLAAKEVRATVLFTDLEGFTTITEAMDKDGIAVSVLSVSTPSVWLGDAAASRVFAREVNEAAAKMQQDYKGRFGHFAALALPELATTARIASSRQRSCVSSTGARASSSM